MTFIAVRCPHCQSDQIVKRGKTARGTQRYLCQNTRLSLSRLWYARPPMRGGTTDGEHGDAGGYAAIGISSAFRSRSGYQRLKRPASSPFNVRTRVCNNRCAPSLDHCICYFLQNRLLTTAFTVDSTNPVAIGSPLRYRSPSFGIKCRLFTIEVITIYGILRLSSKEAPPHGALTVYRRAGSPHRVLGFDQPDPRRISAPGRAL